MPTHPPVGEAWTQALARRVAKTFPDLTARGRLVARETYRVLAMGQPVPDYAIAAATGLMVSESEGELEAWPGVYRNEYGRIIGFWGLGLEATAHSLTIRGKQLFTWCAWDALFLPGLLGGSATAESRSAATGAVITVDVGPDGPVANPPTTVVSFIDPGGTDVNAEEIISTFCQHILFFTDRAEGEAWAATSGNGAIVLSIQDAYEVGRAFNEIRFGCLKQQ